MFEDRSLRKDQQVKITIYYKLYIIKYKLIHLNNILKLIYIYIFLIQ